MTMQPPPSRYKVVERGRRLLVIDTRTGESATRAVAEPPRARALDRAQPQSPLHRRPPPPVSRPQPTGPTPRRTVDDRTGAAVITTARWYDDNGPREVVIDEALERVFGGIAVGAVIALMIFAIFAWDFPWLWLLPAIILFQPRTRAVARTWLTARFDAAQASVNSGSTE